MTIEEISEIGSALGVFLLRFRRCFSHKPTFRHFGVYVRGLLSDLPRKSVEPIALAAGSTVRTLQLFLAFHRWDAGAMRDEVQRRIAQDHLPAPGSSERSDPLGVVGWTDETSVAKKGDKTPGVQRQHCGATGKIDNCIVTVHLACRHGDFMALLDSELFLPEKSWNPDRQRCRKAHIPDSVVYRSKWRIALEQVDRSRSNGIRLDWMSFDEWYPGRRGACLPGGQNRNWLRSLRGTQLCGTHATYDTVPSGFSFSGGSYRPHQEKKSGHHAGASGQSPQHHLPFMDASQVPTLRI